MIVKEALYENGSNDSNGSSSTQSSTAAATRGSKYSMGAGEFDELF
jgi:hypothetical protein